MDRETRHELDNILLGFQEALDEIEHASDDDPRLVAWRKCRRSGGGCTSCSRRASRPDRVRNAAPPCVVTKRSALGRSCVSRRWSRRRR